MALEWDKIKSEPIKSYKIQGHNLLDLKEKLEQQEKSIAELTNTRNELIIKVDSLEEKITNLESEMKEKDEKITSLEENKKEAENFLKELENSLSNNNEEIKLLKEDILIKDSKISELEN